MHEETPFRWALLAGALGMSGLGVVYRLRSFTGERLDRRQEGWPILLGLRLGALVWFAGLAAYLIDPRTMSWSACPLPAWLRWAGVGLGGLGLALGAWTFHTLGRNLTDTVVTRREHTLITHGPYRWVRHPFYVSFGLNVLGAGLAAANAALLGWGVAVWILVLLRTRIEERHLAARFGAAYEDYRRTTGALWPRWRR